VITGYSVRVYSSDVTVGPANSDYSWLKLSDETEGTFSFLPIVCAYSPRVEMLEAVNYTVNEVCVDGNKPGFFFITTSKPLSEAQNDSTIAFSYDPSIVYIVDSIAITGDFTRYKINFPEGVDPNEYLNNHYSNIEGSTIITT